jgi:hypothetical protein
VCVYISIYIYNLCYMFSAIVMVKYINIKAEREREHQSNE